MIRKIVAGLFLIYLSLWYGAAYLIENEITKQTKRGLVCRDIKISGFPGAWKFDLITPELTITSPDEIQIFKSEVISAIVSLSLKTVRFNLGDQLLLETQSSGQNKSYQVELDPLTKLKLRFFKPFLLARNDMLSNLSIIRFNSDNIYVNSEDEELAFLESSDIYLKRTKLDEIDTLNMAVELNYAGANEIFGFDSFRLSCEGDTEYYIDQDSQKIFLKKIAFESLDVEVNEDAYFGLVGSITLSKNEIPIGRFELELQNYSELIDFLWSPGFNLTAKEVKDIIMEATDGDDSQELTIPLAFSSEGITINGRNLKDLRGAE